MNPIDRLTEIFERFPGIGPRQAKRFVLFLLSQRPSFRAELALAIKELGSHSGQCSMCFRWYVKTKDVENLCTVCSNPRRESELFVVEKDADINSVEQSGYRGHYFVLGGVIPLAADEPEKHIRMRELEQRVEKSGLELKEIILGLSATKEGDHTRAILQEKIRDTANRLNIKVSSLGRGLSTGSELEYADPDTIASALHSRA